MLLILPGRRRISEKFCDDEDNWDVLVKNTEDETFEVNRLDDRSDRRQFSERLHQKHLAARCFPLSSRAVLPVKTEPARGKGVHFFNCENTSLQSLPLAKHAVTENSVNHH